MRLALQTLAVLVLLAAIAHAAEPLETVSRVELERYAGRWYEVAALPKFFQKGCSRTTATYSLRDDGDLKVVNRCVRDGEETEIDGKAWVVDEKTNAKLKVRFFWPFSGDYWILALADDYSYAMVGAPDRTSLWILSRQPKLDRDVVERLLKQAARQGFPVKEVKFTEQ